MSWRGNVGVTVMQDITNFSFPRASIESFQSFRFQNYIRQSMLLKNKYILITLLTFLKNNSFDPITVIYSFRKFVKSDAFYNTFKTQHRPPTSLFDS